MAHLYFLREVNKQDAFLVYICFAGAPDVPNPATGEEWSGAMTLVDSYLGLGGTRLKPFKSLVVIDVPAMLRTT